LSLRQVFDDLDDVGPADIRTMLAHAFQHDLLRPFGFPADEGGGL
jgi:hypothetical protein